MPRMWWLVVVVVVLAALFSAYVIWTANRVGRLHGRVTAATAALDAALVRRAVAAELLAGRAGLPEVTHAARMALGAHPGEREAAENDLTHQLRESMRDPQDQDWAALVAACRRMALARQVHTDVVRDAQAVRRRVPVRLLRLAREYPVPTYFDIDDPALDGRRRLSAVD